MEKRQESLLENIKKAFAAFSYEHSGEMLSSHSKSQVLSGKSRDKSTRNISDRGISDRDISARDISARDNSSNVLNKTIDPKEVIIPAYDAVENKPKILAEQ